MFMHDLNTEKEKVCLFIHPMMSSAEGMQICITSHLGDDYRYLLPDMGGHGRAVSLTYHNGKEEAKLIHDYLVEHDIHHLKFAFGASLGGVALLQLLTYPDIEFDHVFFEGASLYQNSGFLTWLFSTVYLSKRKKALKNPEKAIEKMSKMYGELAGKAMVERFVAMNEESIRNVCYDCGHVELPEFSEELQSKMVFAYGEKDFDMKNSKKVQPKKYPKAKMIIWPKYGHCERMSKDSVAYSEMIRQYIEN